MAQKIGQGDLLYHAVHGLCRVDEIMNENQSGKEVLRYSLVPKVANNKMKVRFVLAGADLETSGFHGLISLKEANKILEYLEAGDIAAESSPRPKDQAWELAKVILSFSRENWEVKDQRKRQMLERSAKGLVGELAFVFKTTLKEAAVKVRKSLGDGSKINLSVLTALAHASEN